MINASNLLAYSLYLATRPALKKKVDACKSAIKPTISTDNMEMLSVENWRWIINYINEYNVSTILSQISADTEASSVSIDKIKHPMFKVLVKMGYNSIPYLINHLDKDPECLVAILVLSEITKENPVPIEHRGKVRLIVNDWKEWYKKYLCT